MNNGRNKILAILLFAISVVSMTLFGVSCKKSDDSTEVSVAKAATYYCVTEDSDCFVTLTDAKTYVLSIAGEQKTGSYTLSESGELKLTVDSGEVLATITSDELAITYGGKSYTLLEQIKRSVTFNDNGATTVVTVTNGDTVAKPTDPTDKDGEKFVGWYTSTEYKEVYNFATPVRADTTVYAYHVKLNVGASEFTVTYKDGSDETVSTTNGVVYAPKELDAKDGKEFDGWYVSEFNDESKLTYKYSGETLSEDTNFYPVWRGSIYAVSVYGDKVEWESSETGSYEVVVTDPDGVSSKLTSTQKFVDYAFSDGKVGEYSVKIVNKTSGAEGQYYHNNKALARVSDVTLLDGGIVSYSAVQGAEKYVVTVDCGNKEHKHSSVDNGKYTYFDISGCDMQIGGIKVTIKAEATGYATSETTFVYEKTLDKVASAEVKDGVFVWSAVKNAVKYVVTVGDEEFTVSGTTEFSLKNYARGEYTLGVYPVTKGYNSPDAFTTTYNKVSLSAPEGVTIVGNVVKWDAVEGATSYQLDVNGKSLTSESNQTTLKSEYFVDGVINIKVMAVGESDSENSDYSDVTTLSQTALSGVKYSNGTVSWNPVYQAGGYVVTVNGTDTTKVSANSSSTAVKFKKSGTNTISVKYLFSDGQDGFSQTISVTVYSVKFVDKDGQTTEKFVAKGDSLVYPEKSIAGYDLSGWYNVPSGGVNNGTLITDTTFERSSDLIVYAYYVSKTYVVTLDGESDAISVRFDEEFELPVPDTESTGDTTFGGWYSDVKGGGIAFTDAYGKGLNKWSVAYDITLYPYEIPVFEYTLDNNNSGYIVTEGIGIAYVTSATVPDEYEGKPITSIDSLKNAEKLQSISIPDTAGINLGAGAGLASSVFAQCSALKSIEIRTTGNTDEPKYCSDSGALYSLTMETDESGNKSITSKILLIVPAALDGTFTVASDTTDIGNRAFASSLVERVIIPSSVITVQDYAFADCSKLTSVEFLAEASGETAKPLTFGSLVFDGCKALKTLTLPSRLNITTYTYTESSGDYEWTMDFDLTLLEDSTDLETIEVVGSKVNYSSVDGMLASKDGTTIIYCPKGRSKDANIPSSVKSIGDGAFRKCTFISKVTVPGSVTYIGYDAFRDCTKISSFEFTGDSNDDGLTIQTGALYSTTGLESIVLPENLVSLKAYSIYSWNLKTVTINSVGSVDENGVYSVDFSDTAFGSIPSQNYSTYYVQYVNIGAKVPAFKVSAVFGDKIKEVKFIGANTNFKNESNVLYSADGTQLLYYPDNGSSKFEIPEGVTEISANMFRENESLTEVSIPSTVESIGDNAFYRCTNLKTLTIADGDKNLTIGFRAFYNCTELTGITLPSRLVDLGAEAFYHDYALSSVVFNGSKITEIKSATFDTCRILTEVTVPEGVTTIASNSFARCYKLTKVTLPKTVETIETNAFYLSDELAEIDVDEDNTTYANVEGLLYKKTEGVATELIFCPTSCSGTNGKVTIPNTVTYVGTGVFSGNLLIEEVYFEDHEADSEGNITEVTLGSKLFYGTRNLKKIHLPEGLKTINRNVFWQSGAEEVEIPGTVTTIKAEAFYMAVNLKKLTFAEGSESLTIENGASTGGYESSMYGAFYTCSALEELILPERTVEIGSFAFFMNPTDGKSNLKKVYIPSGVTKIGMYAFYGCNGLTDLSFGKDSKLTTINEYTFYKTAQLKTVTLPSSVTTIGAHAFAYSGLTSISLPESLTSISCKDRYNNVYGAFYGCASLESVVVNSNTSLTIEEKSFADCGNLTSVVIKNSDIAFEVGDNAFYNTSLTSFTFPSGTTKIGKTAFKFTSLETVTFNVNSSNVSALTEIGDEAFVGTKISEFALPATEASITLGKELFKGCVGLTKIKLPATQSSLGESLNGSVAIDSIEVDSASEYMTVDNGVLYNKGKTAVYYVFAHYDGVLDLSSITNISDGAYAGQTDITKVIISGKTIAVGKDAFKNCTSLKEVVFSDNAPSITEISEGAFENCTALESITLPSNVETIGKDVFKNCTSLKTVTFGDKVKTIGESAFDGTGLASVELPQTLESVGIYAFANTALESVTIPASVTSLGIEVTTNYKSRPNTTTLESYAFYGCDKLKTVTFAGDIEAIGSYAFASSGVESVEIPASVEEMGDGVFSGCTSLTSVSFAGGKLTVINESMFKGCTSLASIVIPEGVTSIKAYAFMDCSKLSSVKLPSTLTLMCSEKKYDGDLPSFLIDAMSPNYGYQFANCTSLKEINIPDSVTYIGSYAFQNSGLVKIKLPSSLKYLTAQNGSLGALSSMYKSNYLRGSASARLNTASLQYQSAQFADCKDLEEVILPAELDSLGIRTFWNTPKLKTLTYEGADGKNALPETVKYMAGYQFSGSGLESIVIPRSVIFSYYSNVYVFAESGFKSIDMGSCSFTQVVNYMFYDATKLEEVKLPDGVTSIGYSSFENCSSLASFEMPSTVTTVGNYAFRNSGLVTIDLSNVTSLGTSGRQFYGCTSLRAVNLNSTLTSLPGYMFYNCTSLTSISLPSSLTSIKSCCFEGSGLEMIYIPKGVTNIASKALASNNLLSITVDKENTKYSVENGMLIENGSTILLCSKLPETENGVLTIPEGITNITSYAFNGNTTIKSIVLPSTLTTIPSYAFSGMAIESVTIPDTVTEIGNGAFYKCEKLKSVKIPSSVKSLESGSAFSGCTSLESVDLSEVSSDIVLGVNTFAGTSITSIDLSALSITILPDGLFRNCTKLVNVKLPEGIVYMGGGTFYGCSSLETIDIPASVKYLAGEDPWGESVCDSESQTFAFCSSLKTVNFLGDEVTVIGDGSFMYCTSLESITLPSTVQYIYGGHYMYSNGDYVYYGAFSNSGLKEITIPDGVITIDQYVFSECANLTKVNGCANVTSIASNAFSGCSSLKSYTVSEKVTSIGEKAFASSGLETVVINSNATFGVSVFDSCSSLTSVTLADSTKSLSNGMFKNCTSLKSITLPSELRSVSIEAFANTGLVSVVIPDSVKAIYENAFADCTSLSSVTLGNGVNEIYIGAFANCTSLKKLTVPTQVYTLNAESDTQYISYQFTARSTFEGWSDSQTVEFKLAKYQAIKVFDLAWLGSCNVNVVYG